MASPVEVWKSEDGGVYATKELALEADAKHWQAQPLKISTLEQEVAASFYKTDERLKELANGFANLIDSLDKRVTAMERKTTYLTEDGKMKCTVPTE